jgi:hypothetical protein
MIDLTAIEDRNEWRKKSTDSDRALLAAAVDVDLLLARIEQLEGARDLISRLLHVLNDASYYTPCADHPHHNPHCIRCLSHLRVVHVIRKAQTYLVRTSPPVGQVVDANKMVPETTTDGQEEARPQA